MEIMTKRWPPAERPLKELIDDYMEEYRNELLYSAVMRPGCGEPSLLEKAVIMATAIWDTVSRWFSAYVICPIKGHDLIDDSPPNCGESGAFSLTCRRCGYSHYGYMTGV